MRIVSLLLGRVLIGAAIWGALTGNWLVVGGVVAVYAVIFMASRGAAEPEAVRPVRTKSSSAPKPVHDYCWASLTFREHLWGHPVKPEDWAIALGLLRRTERPVPPSYLKRIHGSGAAALQGIAWADYLVMNPHGESHPELASTASEPIRAPGDGERRLASRQARRGHIVCASCGREATLGWTTMCIACGEPFQLPGASAAG